MRRNSADDCPDANNQSEKILSSQRRRNPISEGEFKIVDRVISQLDMKDLICFLVVGETGSFRKAAEKIGFGQSAVSRRIQKVEDLLGVSLFERRPSGAYLTGAGRGFALRARAIVYDMHVAIEAAGTAAVGQAGHLRIGVIASLSRGPLREIVRAFHEAHQEVDLSIVEAERGELFTLLSHRHTDVVVAAGEPELEIGDGLLLAREKIYLAIPSDHELAKRERLRWEEVREATFLVSAFEPGPEIHDYILRRVSDLGRTARVRRHRLGREGIMTLVGLRLGVSLVADHWRGVTYPNVTFVRIGKENETVPFSVTWRPDNDNPALRRFVSLARVHAKRNASPSAASQSPDPSP